MKDEYIPIAGAIFCLVAGLIFAAYFLTSCQWAKDVDEAIWAPVRAPTTQGGDADAGGVDGGPVVAPPIVETIGAVLALLGFGGMSAWIKRSNNRAKTSNKDLSDELGKAVFGLDRRIARLEGLLNKDDS